MFVKLTKIAAIAGAVMILAGCQGGMRGPQLFTGFNGDPCPPGPKPCPRNMYPEFALPPGGPYLETPAYNSPGPYPQNAAPSRLNLNSNGADKLTITK